MFLVCATTPSRAQTIYTPYAFTNFAGQPGGPGIADGNGSGARFRSPSATAVDSAGNVYVADQFNFTIRKITPAGIVTTLAGTPSQSGTNDGVGSAARFGSFSGGPAGIAVDAATNVYVSDTANFTIRKLSQAGTNWNVTTLAGRPRVSGTNDDTGSAARFTSPSGMTTDSAGNIYVADGFAIRRVTPAGEVTTLAGRVVQAGTTDGTNSAARFGSTFFGVPKGVAVDSALNIYVADTFNSTIRRVSPVGADWVVTTFAGTAALYGFTDGTNGNARFANPHGIAVDNAGNIYVTDPPAQTIRKIMLSGTNRVVTTFAGTAVQLGSNDGTGSAARFLTPQGASVDGDGNLYVADFGNNAIRKITPNAMVTTLAGQSGGSGLADGVGNAAQFYIPHSAAVDNAGNVYVGDTFNHTIRKITPAGLVTTIAGTAGNKGYADGVGTAEAPQFNSPIGLSSDSAGNLYLADNGNETIRKVSAAGVVTTLAGQVGIKGSVNGTGTNALFNSPHSTVVDSAGNVFVSDGVNRTIRKITPGGAVTVFTGSTSLQGTNDGLGGAARFTQPMGLAIDSADNLYVADQGGNTIRKITPGALVTTLAGWGRVSGTNDGAGSAARFTGPQGIAADSAGNVYVTDTGNDTIRKITPGGVVTTLAGSAGQNGETDGTNGMARFDTPRGIAVDSATNIYVADSVNSTIRKLVIVGTNCVVTTLAGGGGSDENGSVDATGTAARFHFPHGLAVDGAGNVYAVDRSNDDIRKITPAGVVTTFAGTPGYAGSADGKGAAAQFWAPEGLAVDGDGNIYVSDYFNNAVRKIAPVGTNWMVTTLAGCPSCPGGTNDGPGKTARFNNAFGLTRDNNGNLYVADTVNKTIRKISPAQPEWIVTTFAGAPLQGGSVDGTGGNARFASPLGLAADANGIYVADSSTIRKITFGGVVTTLAGCPSCPPGSSDGTGTNALFWTARDVAVDSGGNLYVADSANHIIRKLTPAGADWMVTTIAGSPGQASGADGVGSDARFNQPSGVAVDAAGNVYVVDTGENRVTKGTPAAATTVVQFDTNSGNLTISNGFFQLRLTGPAGGDVVVEASTNLAAWTPIQTNGLPLNLSVPLTTSPHQFFRARLVP